MLAGQEEGVRRTATQPASTWPSYIAKLYIRTFVRGMSSGKRRFRAQIPLRLFPVDPCSLIPQAYLLTIQLLLRPLGGIRLCVWQVLVLLVFVCLRPDSASLTCQASLSLRLQFKSHQT